MSGLVRAMGRYGPDKFRTRQDAQVFYLFMGWSAVMLALAVWGFVGSLNPPTVERTVCTVYEDGSIVCDNGAKACRDGALCQN